MTVHVLPSPDRLCGFTGAWECFARFNDVGFVVVFGQAPGEGLGWAKEVDGDSAAQRLVQHTTSEQWRIPLQNEDIGAIGA